MSPEDVDLPGGEHAVDFGADGEDEDVIVAPEWVDGGFLIPGAEAIDEARLDQLGGRITDQIDFDGGQGGSVEPGGEIVGLGRPGEGVDRALKEKAEDEGAAGGDVDDAEEIGCSFATER